MSRFYLYLDGFGMNHNDLVPENIIWTPDGLNRRAPTLGLTQFYPQKCTKLFNMRACPVRAWKFCSLTGQPNVSQNLPAFLQVAK